MYREAVFPSRRYAISSVIVRAPDGAVAVVVASKKGPSIFL